MLKILWKRGKIAPEEQFLPLSTIFYYLMLDFYVKTGIRFSLRDNRSRDKEGRLYFFNFLRNFTELSATDDTKNKCILHESILQWASNNQTS